MSSDFSLHGAVDLGALAAQKQSEQSAAKAGATAPAGVVIDVTTASFETDVIQRSMTTPVILDLWADWCQPCKTLSPLLEKLAAEYAGRFVLAKVDVDAEQQLAAAFQVQSIPSVFAVIGGRPMQAFQGALPEPQLRQVIEAVLAEAAKAGVTSTLAGPQSEPAEAQEPTGPSPADVALDKAYAAIDAADWDAADAAYAEAAEAEPDDPQIATGRKLVSLYRRVDGVDADAALAEAAASPSDADKQLVAADIEALDRQWPAAFRRLVTTVSQSAGDDRAAARTRLLELFEIAGPAEPAVAKARIDLANALF